jgi:hypothetical protein
MAFTVEDFRDLLRLLDERPEWRAELRRQVLSDELLALPDAVRDLVSHVDAMDAQMVTLADHMDALTVRMDALTVRVDALTLRVDALGAQVAALGARVDALVLQVATLGDQMAVLGQRLGTMGDRVGEIEGELLELRYERRAAAYFIPLARKLRVLDRSTLADALDDAVDGGRLSQAERNAVLQADLVLSGQRREDRADTYFVVEVSVGVGLHDVERAVERAAMLAKLGRPAMAVVAGNWINDVAEAAARDKGVWQILDGHGIAPTE